MAHILVLGGDGFCGWPTSLYLSQRGHDVTIVDNLSRRKIDVELEVDPDLSLAPDEQIEVFRIVQEALANVRKHAGARRAWVLIGQRGVERLVIVRDDGTGFEGDTDPAGQGLRNLRERAAAIGGVFSLSSTPGQGTALEVTLRA